MCVCVCVHCFRSCLILFFFFFRGYFGFRSLFHLFIWALVINAVFFFL